MLFRSEVRYAPDLIDRLDDADPTVRDRARAALVRLFGTDAGPDPQAWKDLARQRGVLR